MNRFAELLDRLAYEPGRNNKLRLITAYFRDTPDPDRGYALAALTAAEASLDAAQTTEIQANAAADAARDNATASEWAFHNVVLGMKDQVVAQYGRDSNEAQAVGLKKKSEYKSRGRTDGQQ